MHKEEPRRRPIATLMVAASMQMPRDEIGRVFNRAPASLVEATRRQAQDLISEAFSSKNFTGSVAWVQAGSSSLKQVLVMVLTMNLSRSL